MTRILTAVLLFAATLAGADTMRPEYWAKTGETFEMGTWADFDAGCGVAGLPVYRVEQAPQFGTLSFRPGKVVIDRVRYGADNPCLGKLLDGIRVLYAAGDRPGIDRFTFVRMEPGAPDRVLRTIRAVVTVRKP